MPGPWLEPDLLDPLPAPLPAWIVTPGALLLAVSTPPGQPYRWHSAVAVAWALSPATGTWAVLLAWEAMRRSPDGPPRLAPRCSWCRYVAEQCSLLKPTAVPNPWGLAWHGRKTDGPTAAAIQAAVASLPEPLRKRASTPAAADADLSRLPSLRHPGR
jgi:hypothetical protein